MLYANNIGLMTFIDDESTVHLFRIYSYSLLIIITIVLMWNRKFNPKRYNFICKVEAKRLFFVSWLIIIFYSIINFRQGINIINASNVVYVLIFTFYMQKNQLTLDDMFNNNPFMIIRIFFLKHKGFISLIIVVIGLALAVYDFNSLIYPIEKDILYFSLYSFTLVALFCILIYLLIGDFRLKELQAIETRIMLNDLNDVSEIKTEFEIEIIASDYLAEPDFHFLEYYRQTLKECIEATDKFLTSYEQDKLVEIVDSNKKVYSINKTVYNNCLFYEFCSILQNNKDQTKTIIRILKEVKNERTIIRKNLATINRIKKVI